MFNRYVWDYSEINRCPLCSTHETEECPEHELGRSPLVSTRELIGSAHKL